MPPPLTLYLVQRLGAAQLDRMFLITTITDFQPIGSVDTVHSFYLFDRCSQPQYVRLVERLTVKGYFTNTFTISAYNQ